MPYVIKDNIKDKYLVFDSFVRGMDIVMTAEVVDLHTQATYFIKEDNAYDAIQTITNQMTYLSDDMTVVDVEKHEQEAESTAKENAMNVFREQWQDMSTEDKRQMVSNMSEDKRKQWLIDMGETEDIQPLTDEEELARKVTALETKLGITLTAEQIEQLFPKEAAHE